MFEEDDLMGETTPEEEAVVPDEEVVEEVEPEQPEQPPEDEEPKYKVKFNGKEQELALSDLITHAQKGMNYDHVKGDLEAQRKTSAEAKAALDHLTAALHQFGYAGTPQEMADILEAQRREIEPEQVRREREAAEEQDRIRREAEAAKIEAEQIRREAIFARDLLEIQRINPNVKTLDELGEQFFKLRCAGFGNLEAYEMLNHKPVVKVASTGKEHIQTTGGGATAGGLVDIPKSELSYWREAWPDATPAQLKERYNRSLKRQGGN